jgi:hypothetical protein
MKGGFYTGQTAAGMEAAAYMPAVQIPRFLQSKNRKLKNGMSWGRISWRPAVTDSDVFASQKRKAAEWHTRRPFLEFSQSENSQGQTA